MYLAIKVTYKMFLTHIIIVLYTNYFKYTINDYSRLQMSCDQDDTKCVTIITNSLNDVTLQCSQHQQIFEEWCSWRMKSQNVTLWHTRNLHTSTICTHIWYFANPLYTEIKIFWLWVWVWCTWLMWSVGYNDYRIFIVEYMNNIQTYSTLYQGHYLVSMYMV